MNARNMRTAPLPAARSWLPTVASLRRRFYPDVVGRDPVAAFVRRLERAVKPCDRVLDLLRAPLR